MVSSLRVKRYQFQIPSYIKKIVALSTLIVAKLASNETGRWFLVPHVLQALEELVSGGRCSQQHMLLVGYNRASDSTSPWAGWVEGVISVRRIRCVCVRLGDERLHPCGGGASRGGWSRPVWHWARVVSLSWWLWSRGTTSWHGITH